MERQPFWVGTFRHEGKPYWIGLEAGEQCFLFCTFLMIFPYHIVLLYCATLISGNRNKTPRLVKPLRSMEKPSEYSVRRDAVSTYIKVFSMSIFSYFGQPSALHEHVQTPYLM